MKLDSISISKIIIMINVYFTVIDWDSIIIIIKNIIIINIYLTINFFIKLVFIIHLSICVFLISQVLVIPWFVRMYDAIMHEHERVHYRTYMRRTMV